jgi:hypothetical protein
MVQTPSDDKKQIGLTPAGQASLELLMAEGRFATETDAYRFGITYAIAAGLDLDDAPPGGYATKFNAAGGLDIGNGVRDLLDILEIGDTQRPYATAEKLAELGVTDVARRLQGNESLADIMVSVAGDD